jgi:predicted nuclease of predicted toxin-antitoxin system
MRFLVDAHLPPGLCIVLQKGEHEAIHTRELLAKNRTKDSEINEISIREERIVLSKDTDFYHSHLLQGRPWKLVLVRTGNIGARDLIELFQRHLPALIASLEENTLIEVYREGLQVAA